MTVPILFAWESKDVVLHLQGRIQHLGCVLQILFWSSTFRWTKPTPFGTWFLVFNNSKTRKSRKPGNVSRNTLQHAHTTALWQNLPTYPGLRAYDHLFTKIIPLTLRRQNKFDSPSGFTRIIHCTTMSQICVHDRFALEHHISHTDIESLYIKKIFITQ